MISELSRFLKKPQLYAPGTGKFWDDEHISQEMLAAHLNPDLDGATRRYDFIDQSVKWISEIAPPSQYKMLLDLGCGPGLYAERFHNAGYSVTGVDFSKRSIEYAKEQAKMKNHPIKYHYQNYLTIDYTEQFDVITLIYCDYAVLPVTDRLLLLKKVYRALKPNGRFIFDVFTPRMRQKESRSWQCCETGGFWCERPHICFEAVYQYEDEDATELRQCVVLTDETINCYNIWDHFFTREKLLAEVQTFGFKSFSFYGDVAGKEFSDTGETICGVFTK
ncbi:methyltransferase domain-containing protein [Clostridium sp. MCC353]|uniref:class I SAM-dependent methyltransferase n=1 Tax=Clostridium sp. MCC353 TaxID=2592646 RepID=UPI001C031187|nr:class I SAM-dependent methyltransferase [Clostridium sp. MCC353]MBT9776564.1 methyltransferase domain-containing protein [Clostridium sp. MCC353]